MATLETLLDRADAAAGTEGEARAWLLPLLQRAQHSPPVLSPRQPGGHDSAAPVPPAADCPTVETSPGSVSFQPVSEEAESTPADLDFPSINPEGTEAQPCPASPAAAVAPQAPISSPLPLATFENPAWPPPAIPTALDQAFGPLEIAFPPLPATEPGRSAPSVEPLPAPPPLRHSFPLQEPRQGRSADFAQPTTNRLEPQSGPPALSSSSQPLASQDSAEQCVPSDPTTISPPADPSHASFQTVSQPSETIDRTPSSEGVPSGHAEPNVSPAANPSSSLPAHRRQSDVSPHDAAPVPTFHVEAKEQKSGEPLAPTERSLEAWRVWLPGPFRSRPRK
jgi:hypothetical protein